jgi:hypothetical protein
LALKKFFFPYLTLSTTFIAYSALRRNFRQNCEVSCEKTILTPWAHHLAPSSLILPPLLGWLLGFAPHSFQGVTGVEG